MLSTLLALSLMSCYWVHASRNCLVISWRLNAASCSDRVTESKSSSIIFLPIFISFSLLYARSFSKCRTWLSRHCLISWFTFAAFSRSYITLEGVSMFHNEASSDLISDSLKVISIKLRYSICCRQISPFSLYCSFFCIIFRFFSS